MIKCSTSESKSLYICIFFSFGSCIVPIGIRPRADVKNHKYHFIPTTPKSWFRRCYSICCLVDLRDLRLSGLDFKTSTRGKQITIKIIVLYKYYKRNNSLGQNKMGKINPIFWAETHFCLILCSAIRSFERLVQLLNDGQISEWWFTSS